MYRIQITSLLSPQRALKRAFGGRGGLDVKKVLADSVSIGYFARPFIVSVSSSEK